MNTESIKVIFNSYNISHVLLVNDTDLSLVTNIQHSFDFHYKSKLIDIDLPTETKLEIYIAKNQEPIAGHRWVELEELKKLPGHQGVFLCQALSIVWSKMPKFKDSGLSNDQVSLPRFIYKLNPQKEVTLYGGSFNPWHEGHSACAKLCGNPNLIIVPDYNPWKSKTKCDDICRWESFSQLAKSMKSSTYSFYPGYWGIQTPNPTIDWLKDVEYEIVNIVIGDDNFINFHKWKEYPKIIKLVNKVFIIPRNEKPEDIKRQMDFLSKNTDVSKFQITETHDYMNLSSTQIRNSNC